MKKVSDALIYPLITVILLGGTSAMYWLMQVLSISGGSIASYIVYALVFIALGLAMPYWVIKLGMQSLHLHNKAEKEPEPS